MSDRSRSPPRDSCLRRALTIVGATLAGAVIGALVFLVVLHDPMGMPAPKEPPPANDGWIWAMNMFVGGLGAAIGAGFGALAGIALVVWRALSRRAD